MFRVMFFSIVVLHVWQVKAQQNDILSELRTINNDMAQALIEGDSEKSLSYYTHDVISMPNHSEIMMGIDRIRTANAAMIAFGIKVSRFNLTTVKAFTCDSLVMEIGYYEITLKVPGSAGENIETGKYVTIWQRQMDGSLKIKTELWSALPPENLQAIF